MTFSCFFIPDRLKGLKDYEIVVPRRVDRSGKPYASNEHYLLRKRTRRSTRDRAGGDRQEGDNGEERMFEPLMDLVNSRQLDPTFNDDKFSDEHRTSALYTDREDSPSMLYTLEAFGEKFELELEPFNEFIAPSLLVQYVGTKESRIIADSDLDTHCFHRGKVRGDPDSAVSLSVCHSLVSTPSYNKKKKQVKTTFPWLSSDTIPQEICF